MNIYHNLTYLLTYLLTYVTYLRYLLTCLLTYVTYLLTYWGVVETINMPSILVPSSSKRIATQNLVIATLNGRKDLVSISFSQKIMTCSMLADEAQE